MSKIKTYFLCTRPQFLPASVIPVGLGTAAGYNSTGTFHAGYFILALLAAALYHSGMNVLNDYFDHRNGTDGFNENALTPFTGGSRFIQRGLVTPEETLVLGVSLLASGSVFGIYLAFNVTPILFLIGAVGLLSGVFYSAPPFFFAGRGVGELIVGLDFGVLTVLGSYLVQTGGLSVEALFYSLPVSFFIAALLYVNEFPDFEADSRAGKRTLVVRLGPEKARLGIIALMAGAYLAVLIPAALGLMRASSLIALLSALFALRGVKGLWKNYAGGTKLIPSIKSMILAHASSGALLIVSTFF